jgi:hypothetical protein
VTFLVFFVTEPPPGRPSGAAGFILSGGVGATAPTSVLELPTQNSEEPIFVLKIKNKISKITFFSK